MIRSSALYISLIVSILIVLVCGSMLMIGHTYRMQERKQQRMKVIAGNLESAALLLMEADFPMDMVQHIELFEGSEYALSTDSVYVEKQMWGVYELGTIKSFSGTDTLSSAFLVGAPLLDTLKTLYLADEDRPVSISGKSKITGTAFLPKSGIKAAYVDGQGYQSRTLVYGQTKNSEQDLPDPDPILIKKLQQLLSASDFKTQILPSTISSSFFTPAYIFHSSSDFTLPDGFVAQGHVIISSDSLISVPASCKLDQVILIAPQIKIANGFNGRLQGIASDSILIGDSVRLNYPSALMVLKSDTARFQAQLKIGKGCLINGQLFAWEKQRTAFMPVISANEGTVINGEVWSSGYAAMSRTVKINGSLSAARLMANVGGALYENYLIDLELDKTSLSKYYLSNRLINYKKQRGRLLCRVN